jgi:hypothetical protein
MGMRVLKRNRRETRTKSTCFYLLGNLPKDNMNHAVFIEHMRAELYAGLNCMPHAF